MTTERNETTVSGFRLIVGYLGVLMVMLGVILLSPLLLLFFYPEETVYAKCFIVPGVLTILFGYLQMFFIKGKQEGNLTGHKDAILVVLIWVISIVVSAFPFMILGELNFTQAVFEMTSGYTTTGFTVCNVESLPKIFLFFRSITHFFGGIGLVLVMTSAISDRYGMNLYSAEGHPDKLVPNLVQSARMIFSIYALYIFLGTVSYVIFGMSVFDAFNHSVAAVATGGFSTRSESIAYYLHTPGFSPAGIEITTDVLMILGQTNFIVHLFLIKGKFKKAFRHCEMPFFLILTLLTVPVLSVSAQSAGMTSSAGESVRVSLFQYLSALSSTGYTSVTNISSYPQTFLVVLILIMLIGGGQGSTAGGIKQYRVALMCKSLFWNVRGLFGNRHTVRTNRIYRGDRFITVTEKDVSANNAFILIYLLLVAVGTFVFMACGYEFLQSLFDFTAIISNIGIGMGVISATASPVVLWTGTVGMFIGRLEIYVVLIALIQLGLSLTKKEVL